MLGEKKRGMQAVTQPGMQAVSRTGREEGSALIDYFCKLHLAGPGTTWKESLERWLIGSSSVKNNDFCINLGHVKQNS